MKKDGEIKLLLNERGKGASQKLAAARAGVSERTARKYEQAGKLPSQMKKPRTHRTRDDPFVGRLAVGRGADPRRSGAADEDLVRAAVRRVPGALPGGAAAHVATACAGVAGSPRPGTGDHVSAAARAGAHGAVRLHVHERARRESRRHAVSAPGLPLGADLLECRGGAGVLLGELRGAVRRAGALSVANRWRAGMAPHRQPHRRGA